MRSILAAVAIVLTLTAPQTAGTARVVVARVAAHNDASESSPVVGHATYGDRLEVRGASNGWVQVRVLESLRVGGLQPIGYVPASAVVLDGAGTDAAPKPAATSKSRGGITVAADAAGQTIWIPAAAARVVPIAGSLTSIAAVDAAAVQRALAGETAMPPGAGDTVSWAWVLVSGAAPVVPGTRPEFSVFFADDAVVKPGTMLPALVRLAPAGAGRFVVAALRGRADAPSRDAADWPFAASIAQDAIAVPFVSGTQSILNGRPAAALAPGDYAIVMRPRAASVAGARLLGDDGEGLAAGTVWRFRIGK